MKSGTLVLLLLMSSGLNSSHATTSDYFQAAKKLRKLSLILRGTLPERGEYLELKSVHGKGSEAISSFLRNRATSYMTTAHYIEKMAERASDWLWLRPLEGLGEQAAQSSDEGERKRHQNTLNAVVRRVFTKNLHWNELFSTNQFEGSDSDMAFYELFGLEGLGGGVFQIGAHQDPRVAGILSTQRFLTRYWSSPGNRNLKRAAAVFRILLCDSMTQVVFAADPAVEARLELFRALRDSLNGDVPEFDAVDVFEHPRPESFANGVHAADPECRGCHDKLEPLSFAFRNATDRLLPVDSKGQFVFKRADGTEVRVPEQPAGLGEMVRGVLQTPEYRACQVSQFWEWIMGPNVPLEEARREEVETLFEDPATGVNDLVLSLVGLPEFLPDSGRELNDLVSHYYRARRVLQRCSACHFTNEIPDFTKLPIGGDAVENKYYLQEIIARFVKNGEDMPPADTKAMWLQEDPYFLLEGKPAVRDWICAGAPDQDGQVTTDLEFIESLRSTGECL